MARSYFYEDGTLHLSRYFSSLFLYLSVFYRIFVKANNYRILPCGPFPLKQSKAVYFFITINNLLAKLARAELENIGPCSFLYTKLASLGPCCQDPTQDNSSHYVPRARLVTADLWCIYLTHVMHCLGSKNTYNHGKRSLGY